MKLHVMYTASGKAVSDFAVEAECDTVIEKAKACEVRVYTYLTSSQLIIMELLVRVAEGRIVPNDLVIIDQGAEKHPNDHGQIKGGLPATEMTMRQLVRFIEACKKRGGTDEYGGRAGEGDHQEV